MPSEFMGDADLWHSAGSVSSVVAPTPRSQVRRAAVVVLGDVGRSPRMQYHACALGDAAVDVDLIGLPGTEPFAAVREHSRIRIRLIEDRARAADGRGFAARAANRVLHHARALVRELLRPDPPYDVILVQNPPAVPTLAAAWLAARKRGTRLVIDWHNLAYTVLALRLGPTHPLVRLGARYERGLGRRADAHLCVSQAMRRALADRWGIEAAVLYDRPAAQFAPLSRNARDDTVRRLCARIGWHDEGRPALLVCPTSWTEDDDFPLLFDALPRLQEHLAATGGPAVLVLLTGTGPLRERYAPRLQAWRERRVRLHALWLPADEYPGVLAAADVGLSVHRSASGLDLPMKVADLFGAGVPVCALDYGPCLRELVSPGENGVVFTTAAELAGILGRLLARFPDSEELDRLRSGVAAAAATRWEEAWRQSAMATVLPTLR